jgi:hypothetical protein
MNDSGVRPFRAAMLLLFASAWLLVPDAHAVPINFPYYVGPFANDNLPPDAVYTALGVHRYGPADEIQLQGSTHALFSASAPPPPSIAGASTVHTFNSVIEGDLFLSGSFIDHISADALTTVRVEFDQLLGAERFFDTELLQLDISGGNLPAGVLIRESPTIPSLGQTAIRDIGGGQFQISSFFDVFTELSLDGGQTWIPSNGSVTMQLVPEPATVLLLTGGIVAGAARRRRGRILRRT